MARKKSLRNVGKFILRQDRKSNPRNEYPLYIQYTLDGRIAKGETGVWVQNKDWDENRQRVKGSHPMAEHMNKIIDAKKLSVDTMVLEYLNAGNTLTIEVLRQIVTGTFTMENRKDADLIQFANDNLDYRYKTDKISISTCDNGHCAMNGFKKFVKQKYNRETMMFSQLTETVIDEYIIWRKEVEGNSTETINKTLTPIMKACSSAAAQGLLSREVSDLIALKYLGEKKKLSHEEDEDDSASHYLTEEQLKQLAAMYDEFKYPRTRDYVDMFMFSVYACGLRFSDIMTLEWSHINFETNKLSKVLVKGKVPHSFMLNGAALQILNRWREHTGMNRFVFGLLPDDFNVDDDVEVRRQRINRNTPIKTSLKTIGHKLGLKFNLTMHVARHTWAVLALNKGVEVHKVSALLAHKSILVTEKVYAKFLPKTLEDEVMDKLDFDFSL